VSLKADLAFAGDTQSLSTVNNLLAKVNEVITRQKRHAGILAGAIVAVILAASGAAGFFALGLNIKVPESVTIAPENVEVLGPFASVIKVAGSGVTMRSIDKGTGVAMSIEFEVTEDPVAYEKARVQEEIKNIISEQKWGARDVISYEPRGTYFDIPDIRHDSLGKIFDSICKLEPGTVKKFDIPLNEFRGSITEKKKTTVKLMSAKTLQINTHSAGRVENKTRKDAGKSWTDYQKDFTLK
jgi:hypothetical protein